MIGGKPRSRVALEAEEKRTKARELDRRIRELNRQIERPGVRPASPPARPKATDPSILRRFLRLLNSEADGRRAPLIIEKRRHRNRTVMWAVAALIMFIWALGYGCRFLGR